MKQNKTSPEAFTLIELLVVIAIIGVLASMLLPSFGRGKEKARMTQCLSNLRQIAVSTKLYVDDSSQRFPLARVAEPDKPDTPKEARATLGGPDPDALHLDCFPSAKARSLNSYLRPSEVYRCPVDRGQILYRPVGCEAWLKPSNWETIGCSYQYNAGGLDYLIGGGFKETPEDQWAGIAGKDENWAPAPSQYILFHEPAARLYRTTINVDDNLPRWYQWHFVRGPVDIEDPQTARQDFISPIAFVDGHAAQHNFSKSLSADPYYPYEPTKDWIWYKPKPNSMAQR